MRRAALDRRPGSDPALALSQMPGRCHHWCWCCIEYEEEQILRCCKPSDPPHTDHLCQLCADDIAGIGPGPRPNPGVRATLDPERNKSIILLATR